MGRGRHGLRSSRESGGRGEIEPTRKTGDSIVDGDTVYDTYYDGSMSINRQLTDRLQNSGIKLDIRGEMDTKEIARQLGISNYQVDYSY